MAAEGSRGVVFSYEEESMALDGETGMTSNLSRLTWAMRCSAIARQDLKGVRLCCLDAVLCGKGFSFLIKTNKQNLAV